MLPEPGHQLGRQRERPPRFRRLQLTDHQPGPAARRGIPVLDPLHAVRHPQCRQPPSPEPTSAGPAPHRGASRRPAPGRPPPQTGTQPQRPASCRACVDGERPALLGPDRGGGRQPRPRSGSRSPHATACPSALRSTVRMIRTLFELYPASRFACPQLVQIGHGQLGEPLTTERGDEMQAHRVHVVILGGLSHACRQVDRQPAIEERPHRQPVIRHDPAITCCGACGASRTASARVRPDTFLRTRVAVRVIPEGASRPRHRSPSL